MSDPTLRVRGARVHNLRDLDLELPLGGLTALVGPSGSGKSSLARDVLARLSERTLALARRRGARERTPPVAVDLVEGLPLVIYLGPDRPPPGERLGDLLDLLAPLAALAIREGETRCPSCGAVLPSLDPARAAARALHGPEGLALLVLAPLRRQSLGSLPALLAELSGQGFARVRLDGEVLPIDEVPPQDGRKPHDLDLVIDRLRTGPGRAQRLEEAIGLALVAGQGRALLERAGAGEASLVLPLGEAPWCPAHPELQFSPPRVERLAGADPNEGAALRWPGVAPTWPALLELPVERLAERLQTRAAADGAVTPEPLRRRLEALLSLGLGGLELGRPTRALSRGEYDRARIAWASTLDLPDALYIFDDLLAHLGPADRPPVRARLRALADAGRRLWVLDHDALLARQADTALVFGPGSGTHGGRLLWQGRGAALPPTALPPLPDPPTPPHPPSTSGPRLTGEALLPWGPAAIPLVPGTFLLLHGPSGAGKSRLIEELLRPALAAHRDGQPLPTGLRVEGVGPGTPLLVLDEAGRASPPWAMTASTLGLWPHLRALLLATREARMAGVEEAALRLDRPGGRCARCEGSGLASPTDPDAEREDRPCPDCDGSRFTPPIARLRLKGHDLRGLWRVSLAEAAPLFQALPRLGEPLRAAVDLGLGHLPLGQPSASLSSGERQRLRLARELVRVGRARLRENAPIAVLDAPTAGLHPTQAEQVARALVDLARQGAVVVAASHDPALLRAADAALPLGRAEAQPA